MTILLARRIVLTHVISKGTLERLLLANRQPQGTNKQTDTVQ